MIKVIKDGEIKEIYPHRLETHIQCGYSLYEEEPLNVDEGKETPVKRGRKAVK